MSPAGATAKELLSGLRLATTTIAGAVVITASLPRKLDVHLPVEPQIVAYAAVVSVILTETVLLLRGSDWGRLRGPAVAVALSASALSAWTLRPELLTTSADWSFGTTSWAAVVILFGRRMRELVAFLALHESVVVARVLTVVGSSDSLLPNLVAGSVGTIGFPLACGIASTAVRRLAADAERAATEAAALRTQEAVAKGAHEVRRARLARLDAAVEPLLCALADGTASPADPVVRRASAVQAARIRRLLAESDVSDDPLLHELRHGADVAERRGVVIDLATAGSWSVPDREVRRALLDGPLGVLTAARTRARVTVVGLADQLVVGVIADADVTADVAQPEHADVRYTIVRSKESAWIDATWNMASRSSSSTTTRSRDGD